MEVQFTPRRRSMSAEGYSTASTGSAPFVKSLNFTKATAQTPGRYLASKRITEPLKVFLRIRPNLSSGTEEYIDVSGDKSVVLHTPETSDSYKKGDRESKFDFTKVFSPTASQENVYNASCKPLVNHLFNRRNGLLFAYGITNSGKTYTIQGSKENPGIVRNVLSDIFEKIDQNSKYTLWLSFLEIYNEKIYDLLSDRDPNSRKQIEALRLVANKQKQVYVRGLMEVEVDSEQQALELIAKGERHRKVGETNINSDSSRSHAVFTIKLLERQANGDQIWSKLCLVDLAGAERTRRTATDNMHHQGERFKESVKINTSLMKLGRCLEILRWNQQHPDAKQKVVPFREAKITRLFKDFLLGWGYTVMIATASPNIEDYDETYHSLRYAAIAKEIVCSSRIDTGRVLKKLANVSEVDSEDDSLGDSHLIDDDGEFEELLDEIYSLKKELLSERERSQEIESALRQELVQSSSMQMEAMEEEFAETLQDQKRRLEKKFSRQLELWKEDFIRNASGDGSEKENLLQKENHSLQVKCNSLSEELFQTEKARSSIESKLNKSETFCDSLQRSILELKSRLEQSVVSSAQAQDQIENLEKVVCESHELKAHTERLEKRLEEFIAENEILAETVEQLEGDKHSVEREKHELVEKLEQQQEQQNLFEQSTLESFQLNLSRLEEELSIRAERTKNLVDENKTLVSELAEKETLVTQLELEISQLKQESLGELSASQSELKELTAELKSLKKESQQAVKSMTEENTNLLAGISEKESVISQLESEIVELKEEYSGALSELKALKKDSKQGAKAMGKENAELSSRVAELEELLDESTGRNEILRQEHESLFTLLQEKDADVQELKASLEQLSSGQSSEFEAKLSELSLELKSAKKELKASEKANKSLEKKLGKIEGQLQARDVKIEHLVESLESKTKEFEELESKVQLFEDELSAMEGRFEEQSSTLQNLVEEKLAKEAHIQSLEEQIVVLQSEEQSVPEDGGFEEDDFVCESNDEVGMPTDAEEEDIPETPQRLGSIHGTLKTSRRVMDILQSVGGYSPVQDSPVAESGKGTRGKTSNTWDQIMNNQISSDWLSVLKQSPQVSARVSDASLSSGRPPDESSEPEEDKVPSSDQEQDEGDESFKPIARRLRRRR